MVNENSSVHPKISVCYIAGRESEYARNRVLTQGMRATGIEVFDCSLPKRTFLRHFRSFTKFLKYKNQSDFIFVGFLGHFWVLLIKMLTSKRIIFDAFISIFQTMTFDRRLISPQGATAQLARFIDRRSCQLSDLIFLDTEEHINYFVEEFEIPRSKLHKLPVGSDNSVMFPRPHLSSTEFLVHFHGEFQALHGVEYIIRAAQLLPEIKFQFIGTGKTLQACLNLTKSLKLSNCAFLDPVPYQLLAEYMAKADICLGIFGNTQKAKMVAPHKVYEALAMRKPLITSNTPAIREFLTDKQHAILCQEANPSSLAESIMLLKNNAGLRENIAQAGHQLFLEHFTPPRLGKIIYDRISSLAH